MTAHEHNEQIHVGNADAGYLTF